MFYNGLNLIQITPLHDIFIAVEEEDDAHMQQQDNHPKLCIGIIIKGPSKTIADDACRDKSQFQAEYIQHHKIKMFQPPVFSPSVHSVFPSFAAFYGKSRHHLLLPIPHKTLNESLTAPVPTHSPAPPAPGICCPALNQCRYSK